MIEAAAPGKIVLWGEYAVLQGAPALVLAVDRYATCRLQPAAASGWHCSASGFSGSAATLTRERLLSAEPPPRDAVWSTLWHVLQALDARALPAGGDAHFDTRAFHYRGAKLGLGSSAALCVAVYGAACRLLEQPADLDTAVAIHRRLQGGAGSGIDVAAAWLGGALRCRRRASGVDDSGVDAEVVAMPRSLHTGYVWTGTSTRTTDHLARLQCWLDGGGRSELEALAVQAERLFASAAPLEAIGDYGRALRNLDRAAGLGVFSASHDHLSRLAIDAGVVYKPCGAGGGDVGAAFAETADAIERFNGLAAAAGFLPLALETASHGIEVTG